MRRMTGPALALVLVLAGAGGAWAQEAGDGPDLDVDITIDVITDFDHPGPGPDIGGLEPDDGGDIHVVYPEDRDHYDGAEVGDHEGEAGDHESEVEDHESEAGEDLGGDVGTIDEGADTIEEEHDD